MREYQEVNQESQNIASVINWINNNLLMALEKKNHNH
jgi:Asp-tRNA(Asn)/Glu-tRNA(Gln) amidotransferase B subunit